jgi:hypothetical protein
MALGDFARLDDYDPEGGFKDTFKERFGAAPLDPFEAAALRQRQFTNRPSETSQETIDRAAGVMSDVLIPKTPLDVGLTLATLPAGPLARPAARIGALAAGALLEPSEAQAHNSKLARVIRGWTGPVGSIAEAGHIPRGTHANWYMRHDPQGNVALSNESGPTGNRYAVNLKGGMTPEEMAARVSGDPAVIPKGREFDLDELRRQKAEFVFGPTDPMASGGWLNLPGGAVKQEGGIGFMQAHKDMKIPGMPEDVQPLYASVSKAAASKANKTAEDVVNRGGVPVYVPTIMGPGSGDSTKQMAFSTLSALREADPTSKGVKALDAAVRAKGKGAKDYPGYGSEMLSDWLTTSGLKGRRAFVEGASARSAADETGVDVSLLRYLNTDPRLRHTPSGSAGVVMGRMRPDVGVTEYPLHSNYPVTFMGQKGEIGGLPGNMPFSQIAPDMFRGLLKYRSPGGGLFADTPAIQVMRGLASDVPQTQPVTKEVVDNWRRWFDKNPTGWAIPGAAGLGTLAAQDKYQRRKTSINSRGS